MPSQLTCCTLLYSIVLRRTAVCYMAMDRCINLELRFHVSLSYCARYLNSSVSTFHCYNKSLEIPGNLQPLGGRVGDIGERASLLRSAGKYVNSMGAPEFVRKDPRGNFIPKVMRN